MLHEHNGKQFEIRLVKKPGGFEAKWICLSCLQQSVPRRLRITADDALEDAKSHLVSHTCPK